MLPEMIINVWKGNHTMLKANECNYNNKLVNKNRQRITAFSKKCWDFYAVIIFPNKESEYISFT